MAYAYLKHNNKLPINELKYKHQFLKIEINIDKYNDEYEFFLLFFKPLLELENNDKLSVDNNCQMSIDIPFKINLDKYDLSQSFRRWYYKQKREDIFNKLDIVFEKYNNFIISIKNKIQSKKILENMIELNKLLTIKLIILDKTYNDPKVSSIIDKYLKICQ